MMFSVLDTHMNRHVVNAASMDEAEREADVAVGEQNWLCVVPYHKPAPKKVIVLDGETGHAIGYINNPFDGVDPSDKKANQVIWRLLHQLFGENIAVRDAPSK